MRKFQYLPLTLISILISVFSLEAESILLIGNKSDDTLTFVDTATLEIVGEAKTGRGPHELTATPDGKWAYVSNYEGSGNSLSLIDVAGRKEVKKIPLEPYLGPHKTVSPLPMVTDAMIAPGPKKAKTESNRLFSRSHPVEDNGRVRS